MNNEVKYIFVTGGVLSALGKGVAAASIANILESYGYKIRMIKLDPYLNVDPGTMSPFQHGEVYVTEDGAETDLDLGHYERFTKSITKQDNNWTAGKIYYDVIEKERKGDYLGKTVQVIPHITNEIKDKILSNVDDSEIIIVEIGGTVGDIESLPFLEAIRQIGLERDEKDCVYVHLTLVPYLKAAGELKTKPTQHSVKELRKIGIQPDILLCRSEIALPEDIKKKIALFCNIKKKDVVNSYDVDSIYEIPLIYKREGLGEHILKKLNLEKRKDESAAWINWFEKSQNLEKKVRISVVGKYVKFGDSYKSLNEALNFGGVENNCEIELHYVEAENLLDWNLDETFADTDAILVPGGFGGRGIEGMICAAEYARGNKIPYFGICLGMQVACIEFIRNVCNIKKAHSSEFYDTVEESVFVKLKELKGVVEMGHNMRLGNYKCILKKDSLAYKVYQQEKIMERHRHRYEFSPYYEDMIEEKGMIVSGKNPERNLVEIVEVKEHPWFLGCQFHPEYRAKPLDPHPLFVSFINAALKRREKR